MRKLPHSPMRLLAGLLGGLGLLAAEGFALSQVGLNATTLSGAEAVVVAASGPGGPSVFTTTGRLSSGYSNVLFNAFPASFTVGQVTGGVNTANMVNGGVALLNAANTAATITMPATNLLLDGEIIGFCNVTAAAFATNAVTIAGNSGQTLNATNGTLTTLAAGACGRFLWNAGSATWFRVQ